VRLAEIAPSLSGSFVVDPPAGARVRTRLVVSPEDEAVLAAVGGHLGRLAGTDLLAISSRSYQGIDISAMMIEMAEINGGRAVSRKQRRQAMTSSCSSRWAGAITRCQRLAICELAGCWPWT
jgi:hypothetical protein